MKKLMLFSTGIVLLTLACKKDENKTSQQKTFIIKTCTPFTVNGNNVEVCYDSVIEDSRCPQNALCAWAGAVAIAMKFKTNGQTHIVKLALPKTNAYPFANDTTVGGYNIKLDNVYPYPILPVTTAIDTAINLTITK